MTRLLTENSKLILLDKHITFVRNYSGKDHKWTQMAAHPSATEVPSQNPNDKNQQFSKAVILARSNILVARNFNNTIVHQAHMKVYATCATIQTSSDCHDWYHGDGHSFERSSPKNALKLASH